MYLFFLTLHSWFRWVVLLSLGLGLYRSYRGWLGQYAFTPLDNTIRHTTATIAHVQLMLGYVLYFQSPTVSQFLAHRHDATYEQQPLFFGLLHVVLMTVAIVVLTIGSSLAKRRPTSPAKFRTMALWFTAALLLLFLAIPWPFSPLASRPYFRF